MKNFKDVQNLELSENDKELLSKLKDSKEWQFLQKLLEAWVLKLNANSLVGTETEEDSAEKEFKELRAFTRRWKRFVSLIENKNE